MNWWKRCILSIISLVWGFISLDYLYLAFGMLVGDRPNVSDFPVQQVLLYKFAGLAMLLLWIVLMVIYTRFLRSISPQIDLIEENRETGEKKMRHKWFEVILQYAFVVTGLLLRWGYLCLIYFPRQ